MHIMLTGVDHKFKKCINYYFFVNHDNGAKQVS